MNHAVSPRRPMLMRDLDIALGVVGSNVREFVAQEVGPLVARLAAAEAELEKLKAAPPPTLVDSYAGTWHPREHQRGNTVTWGGSLWLAMRDTTSKPGGGDDWKLVVKRGADGKDLRG